MSESAVILEGEVARRFNPVDKLRATNQDSSVSDWVPSDTLDLGSLMASENNLYLANLDDDCDAYEEVEVDVSTDLEDADDLTKATTKITGKDPDSGETLEVGLDEDGNLMEQALPDHIHIVVWPRKRHYQEGEIIDFSGIHVYLMKQGTTRFTCEQYPTGEIPFSELIFPVTVATGSGSSSKGVNSDIAEGILEQPIPVSGGACEYRCRYTSANIYDRYSFTGSFKATGFHHSNGVYTIMATDQPQSIVSRIVKRQHYENSGSDPNDDRFIDEEQTVNVMSFYMSNTYTHNNKTVYYLLDGSYYVGKYELSIQAQEGALLQEYRPDISSNTEYVKKIAWAIVYGEEVDLDDTTIPVQWMRSDGEILEDTYEITIGEGEDPEPEPDPYAGQCDFTWEGKKYCFNKSLARSEVMYSNGTVWQTWLGGQSPPYTVDQALKLELIVLVE